MNKILLLLTALLFTGNSFSQESHTAIAKLNYGDVIHYDDIEVRFQKVIVDSRCPSNVNCIRAGEAKVLVAVYENGVFLKSKTLVFHASGFTNEETTDVFVSKELNVSGLALFPYPETTDKIPDRDYFIKLRLDKFLD